jgi:hypothetical protein
MTMTMHMGRPELNIRGYPEARGRGMDAAWAFMQRMIPQLGPSPFSPPY